jgi:glycosyltransferase 2 family protein
MTTASPLRDARRWLPGVIVSLIAIFILAYLVDWHAVVLAFTNLDWRVIPFFITLYFASTASRAMASRTLLENRPTLPQAYFAMMQGYLLNNLLPLRLGELGRAFLLGRKINVSMFHVLSTIVIERVIDLAMAAALTIVVLPRVVAMDWVEPVAYSTLTLVVIGLLSLALMARFRTPLHGWVEIIAGRVALVKKYLLPILDSLLDGLSALTSLRGTALTFSWMGLAWLFGITNYWVLLRGFVPDAPYWWALFVIGLASFGVALPSAPAALGVFEGAIVAALVLLGVPPGEALAYAILLHCFHIIISSIFGFYGFAKDGESLMGMYDKLANRPKENQPSLQENPAANPRSNHVP